MAINCMHLTADNASEPNIWCNNSSCGKRMKHCFLLYTQINILSSENGPIIVGKWPGQNVKFLGYGRFVLGSTDI